MKKTLSIIGVTSCAILIIASCVYATKQETSKFLTTNYITYNHANEKKSINIEIPKDEIERKGNEIVDVLNSHSLQTNTKTSVSEKNNYSIKEIIKDNNYGTEGFLYTNNTNYEIQLNTNDLSLLNIKSLDINYDLSSEGMDKNDVKKYIEKIYNDLGLNMNYELIYLEEFGGALWEADFQKNYDGIYNPYEAVKIIFSPIEQKIASLKVFDIKYDETQNINVTKEEAIKIFNTNIDNLVHDKTSSTSDLNSLKTELVLTRPNNLTDSNRKEGSKVLYKNIVRKAWKVTDLNGNIIYVDTETSEIIGGGQVK